MSGVPPRYKFSTQTLVKVFLVTLWTNVPSGNADSDFATYCTPNSGWYDGPEPEALLEL
jgi:hypothetical protein